MLRLQLLYVIGLEVDGSAGPHVSKESLVPVVRLEQNRAPTNIRFTSRNSKTV